MSLKAIPNQSKNIKKSPRNNKSKAWIANAAHQKVNDCV